MRRVLLLATVAALAACSPKAPEEAAPTPAPVPVANCNQVAPDFQSLVEVQDEAAVTMAAELLGGPITPGTYDLVSAVAIGAATGWNGGRAVALSVQETGEGVILNWAGGAPAGAIDTWTATLLDTPDVRLTYTCGRVGTVAASYGADDQSLELRLPDGANGTMRLVFQRRA